MRLGSVEREQTIRSKDGSEYTTRRTEIELHDAKDAVVQMAKLHGMFREDSPTDERENTREWLEEQWERLRRVQSIEALEKMLTEPKPPIGPP